MKWSATVLVIVTAYFLRVKVFTTLPPLPLLFFLPAILFSAILFGRSYGVLATLLSSGLTTYFFLPPTYSFAISSSHGALSLVLFFLTGLLITAMGSALRIAYREAESMRQEITAAYVLTEKARAQAEAGERERQLLLIEFGHRVKNDMQRIISTFHLQAAQATPEVAAALRQAANQVNVIATMHDRLAHRDGEVSVDMQEFLQDLVSGLRDSMAQTRPIGIFIEAETHYLPLDRAIAVGLITNELVTNALKHAFPEDRSGSIMIKFCLVKDGFRLIVSDNGRGLADTTQNKLQRQGGLGSKLTRALAAQLGGQIETAQAEPHGTKHILSFPAWLPSSKEL